MTNVVFMKKNDMIIGYECSGHTGYGEHGYDIVCSALSSMTQSVALGRIEVLGIRIDVKRNDDKGYLRVILPKEIADDKLRDAQVLLATLKVSVADLAKDYSKFIKLEEREYVY